MGILNRIINILILLAAIAAAVFSYLLFSKREKLVNGWGKMADAIVETAKVLDKDNPSGTAAKDLPKEKLAHTNYEQLDVVLPNLKNSAAKIVEQRNVLAGSIKEAADQMKIAGIDAAQLKNESAHKDQTKKFVRGVKEFFDHRNRVFNAFAEAFRLFGANVTSSDLADPQKYQSNIETWVSKMKASLEQRAACADCLKKTAVKIGVTAPNVNSPGYKAELEKFLKAVGKKMDDMRKLDKKLKDEQEKTKKLEKELASRARTIASTKSQLEKKALEIQVLNNILTKENTKPVKGKLLTSQDERECYQHVKGFIEYVDKDYGFVTINIGQNFSFVQEYGIKQNRVHFPLKTGKVMTVQRRMDNGDLLAIGKIRVVKVDANSSVCNIIGGQPNLYREGDLVSFTSEDIEQALKPGKN